MAWYWLLLLPTAAYGVAALIATIGFAVQATDRNEPVMITAPVLSRIAREAAARTLLRLLGWLALGPAPLKPANLEQGRRMPPVVMIPGMTWNRASLWPLALFLRRRGWRWVYPIDRQSGAGWLGWWPFSERTGRLASEADALALHIQRVLRETGAPVVDLVGFSTGGLVAAWLLRHHPDIPVRRLVTIGTAWKGSRMAVFSRGEAVDEVRYGSHVLDGLWPPPVPTVCIYSPDDLVVVPASSATPQGLLPTVPVAAPPGGRVTPSVPPSPVIAESVRVEQGGHVELLLSARVLRAVLAALDHPLPEPAPLPSEVEVPEPVQPPLPELSVTIVPPDATKVGE